MGTKDSADDSGERKSLVRPSEEDLRGAVYTFVHVFGLVHSATEDDIESTELVREIVDLVERYQRTRAKRAAKAYLDKVTSVLAEMYRSVDEEGSLRKDGEAPASALERFLGRHHIGANNQRDFLAGLFGIPRGKHEALLRGWTLTRRQVTEKGGPVQTAALAVDAFKSRPVRTYYADKARPSEEQHGLDGSLYWNQLGDLGDAVAGVLQILGATKAASRRAVAVAFDGKDADEEV